MWWKIFFPPTRFTEKAWILSWLWAFLCLKYPATIMVYMYLWVLDLQGVANSRGTQHRLVLLVPSSECYWWIACWAQCVSIRCDWEAPVCAPGSLSTASCVVCTYLPTVLWPATMCTGYCTASCVNHVYAGFYVAVYIIIYYVWCGIECVVFFSLVHKTDYGALYTLCVRCGTKHERYSFVCSIRE